MVPAPSLIPRCQKCAVIATPANPMATCSRCRGVLYCCREHQQQDFAEHKALCKRTKQCDDLLAREEATLRGPRADNAMRPANVFEEAEGMFWLVPATQPYMRAKYELIRTLSVFTTYEATERALATCMDSLRLCRGDNIGIREIVPTLLLLLGRFQEAYDFIKWYATADPDGTFEWGNPQSPFLTVKNADMTEPVTCFANEGSCFFLGMLAYIKVTLALQLWAALQSLGDDAPDDARVSDDEAASMRSFFVTSASGVPRTRIEVEWQLHLMQQQIRTTFELTHARNANYWSNMLNPVPLLQEADPGYYAFGDRFQIKIWLMPNAYVWSAVPEYIEKHLKTL